MSSTRPPELPDGVEGLHLVRVHPWCGRPLSEHPPEARLPGAACPFPAQAPVEFAVAEPGPVVRVCGIPDPSSIPPEVMRLLGDLARACRDAYGMGVEVEGPGGRETALDALDTLRRYLS